MGELLGQISGGADTFGLAEVLIALVLSYLLCLIVAYFYRQSHRGLSYSVSFVHAMILLGVTVSVIMLIIGSGRDMSTALFAPSPPRTASFAAAASVRGEGRGEGSTLACWSETARDS